MPDCEHPSPAGCYTCLSDRQLLALTAEHLCQILETGIPPLGLTDVNIVSSVVLTVQGDTGRTWTLDFASDQVDASGSVVSLDTGTLLEIALRGDTGTVTSVPAAVVSTTLLAANPARISATITNDGASTLYVKDGATASSSSYTYRLSSNASVIIDDYTGIIEGIWTAALGNARVTEVT